MLDFLDFSLFFFFEGGGGDVFELSDLFTHVLKPEPDVSLVLMLFVDNNRDDEYFMHTSKIFHIYLSLFPSVGLSVFTRSLSLSLPLALFLRQHWGVNKRNDTSFI